MNKLTKVIDLQISDKFKYNGACVLIVREIDKINSKIIATKETAKLPHGKISLSFYSSKHDDLFNRVTRIL